LTILYLNPDDKKWNPKSHASNHSSGRVTWRGYSLWIMYNHTSGAKVGSTPQVPRLGARVDTGGPFEYLHWPHAKHLSNFRQFSKVQNLQDQILFLVLASLGFCAPQSSHIGASCCSNPTHDTKNAHQFSNSKKKTRNIWLLWTKHYSIIHILFSWVSKYIFTRPSKI
jgi:hypothetical protein